MNYKKIDMENWPRKPLYDYYLQTLKVVMSLTVDIDVTKLVAFGKKHSIHFYPLMIWVVSKVINNREEFKYNYDSEGNLILWDRVFPSYTDFYKNDQNFSKMATEYCDDVHAFCKRVMDDRIANIEKRGFLEQPANCFNISCLPWVHYSHVDLHIFDEGKTLCPMVIWGKYQEQDGKIMLPLSLQIHHAVADGFHLSRFFTDVQALIDTLE